MTATEIWTLATAFITANAEIVALLVAGGVAGVVFYSVKRATKAGR